jgi:hypothetical protein
MSKRTTTSDLPKLAAPVQRALAGAGLTQLKQLPKLTEAELLQLPGMGKNVVATLRAALAERSWAIKAEKPKVQVARSLPTAVRRYLTEIYSTDRPVQGAAYQALLKMTEAPVDWAYAVWDELLAGLTHKDNHVRSICAQVLANLAKSDPQGRMLKDFEKLLQVTRDERFVTARHCLQSLWKVGLGGRKQQDCVLAGFTRRFAECEREKTKSILRADIIQGLKNLYQATTREQLKTTALALIDTEPDAKLRKKYLAVWRK